MLLFCWCVVLLVCVAALRGCVVVLLLSFCRFVALLFCGVVVRLKCSVVVLSFCRFVVLAEWLLCCVAVLS